MRSILVIGSPRNGCMDTLSLILGRIRDNDRVSRAEEGPFTEVLKAFPVFHLAAPLVVVFQARHLAVSGSTFAEKKTPAVALLAHPDRIYGKRLESVLLSPFFGPRRQRCRLAVIDNIADASDLAAFPGCVAAALEEGPVRVRQRHSKPPLQAVDLNGGSPPPKVCISRERYGDRAKFLNGHCWAPLLARAVPAAAAVAQALVARFRDEDRILQLDEAALWML